MANVQILTTLEKVRKIFKHDVHITDTEHPQVHLGVFQSLIGFFYNGNINELKKKIPKIELDVFWCLLYA